MYTSFSAIFKYQKFDNIFMPLNFSTNYSGSSRDKRICNSLSIACFIFLLKYFFIIFSMDYSHLDLILQINTYYTRVGFCASKILTNQEMQQIINYIIKDNKEQDAQALKNQLKKGQKFNRIYGKTDQAEGFISTFFLKPLIYAEEPYFCPHGWMRCSLDVNLSKEQFSTKYKQWPVCYHGTSSSAAFAIISKGFKANPGCWIDKHEKAIYLTPSIIYASHPRYSKVQKWGNKYYQLILQLRVKKELFIKKPGTLEHAFENQEQVDSNYSNKVLQWVCKWNSNSLLTKNEGILVYGIMLKISSQNPYDIKGNKWYGLKRND